MGSFGRPANLTSNPKASPIETVISAYDLLIFDIFDQRGPECGWRSKFSKAIKCVVIENSQLWTSESDMIVLPNLLDKHTFDLPSQKYSGGAVSVQTMGPKVVGGEAFIILRNEIRRLASNLPLKEIDVLVYLHDFQLSQTIKKILMRLGLTFNILDVFKSGFAPDLARARIFISGFGVSFNEALALKTWPVCWPDSDAHQDDATRFYRHFGMDPLIVDSAAAIKKMILPLLNKPISLLKPIHDGTPNIVAEIAALFTEPVK